MMNPRRVLVVGAHSGDFVWRAAGTIAVITSQGGQASVIALSYGERGESGELWKEPDQTVENVKRIRHEEAKAAAEAVEAEFRCLDLGDYPLNVPDRAIEQLVEVFQDFKPNIVLTHNPVDPFNPDHPAASQAVQNARLLSSGAGVASAFSRIPPPDLYFFEPHQPELCDFKPNTFIDITTVMEKKTKAMEAMKAQRYLHKYYTELASRRANHARRISGMEGIKFAEAHYRTLPWVVTSL
ncbi:MAG TPA: PIG-L deacetylase family protein [Anaerolineales bacterium]|nr:PIG-L deacetylase family protein [Anaerolineales bacterium]